MAGDSGSFLRIDRPLDAEIGEAFVTWAAAAVEHGSALGRNLPAEGLDYRRSLFLDTETTGLGGAGCLVFPHRRHSPARRRSLAHPVLHA